MRVGGELACSSASTGAQSGRAAHLTSPNLPCIMRAPQAGWAIAASLAGVEESPYSTGRGAGEDPGRSDLSEKGHRKEQPGRCLHRPGDGEKAAQETTGVRSNAGGQATPVGSKDKQRQWSGPLRSSLG